MTQPGDRWVTVDGCLCWEVIWLSDIWLGTGVSLVHTSPEQLLQIQVSLSTTNFYVTDLTKWGFAILLLESLHHGIDHSSTALLGLHVPWQNKTTTQGMESFWGAWLHCLPLVERNHEGQWTGLLRETKAQFMICFIRVSIT